MSFNKEGKYFKLASSSAQQRKIATKMYNILVGENEGERQEVLPSTTP